jgi:hypothetical protein
MEKINSKYLQIINIISFLTILIVNILANTLPINGKNTGELSDLYPNLFVPAGYVFSIWFVIYLLLLGFTIYQASPKRRESEFINKIGYFFGISSLANMIWIFMWHYEIVPLSLLAMIILLGSLIIIYLRLDIGRNVPPREEKIFVQLPFSIYLGWITVATIANVVALLVSINWGRFGISEVTWTVGIISVAIILTLINVQKRGDIGYSMVIIWTLGGIIVKQMGIQNIVITAWLGVVLIIAFLALKKLRIKL